MNLKDKVLKEFKKIRSKCHLKLSQADIHKIHDLLKTRALKPVITHVKEFLALLHSIFFDGYEVSKEITTTVTAALLYLAWVFDVIPDFAPVIGFTDDIVVILTAASMCAGEFEKFRQWKNKNN